MSKYVKPVISLDEGMAEGVYAASGCLVGKIADESYEGGMGNKYRFAVYYTHETKEHSNTAQTVVVKLNAPKLATTSSTGGLLLALQRAIVTIRPKGRYRKHFCWPAIKRYYSNLLVSILLLALLYTFELLHLLYCQSFQHNIL